jgi:4-amino-4-deoxy-L-arabinose transferase-like glycosyltransferase
VRIPFALYAFALLVRGLLFAVHPGAGYPDSFYYADVARAVQAGHGFNVDFIYSFLDVGGHIPASPHLPIPSNGFWMPLASIVQLPSVWLLGPTQLASALPFMLIGALAAPLTWLAAREAGCGARVAIAASVAVGIPAAAAIYMVQPDNFSLYQPIVTAALWLTARGLKGHRRSFALAGLMAGLAALSRNDGVLVAAVVGLAFLWDRWRSRQPGSVRPPQIPWRYAVAAACLFLAVMAPWYLRQFVVFGNPSPSSSLGSLVGTYDDTNCVTCSVSLQTFLGQGAGSLLASRLLGLIGAVAIFGALVMPIVLTPFVLVGARQRRRSVDFGPFFVFAALFFAVSILVFAVYIPHGTFLHSAVALMPFATILAMEGIVAAVTWVVRRRPSWRQERAERMFLAAGVASMVLTAVLYTPIATRAWDLDQGVRTAAAAALDAAGAPASDLLLTSDPAGFEYFTGRGGVVTPNDSLAVIHEVAADYGTRWLILERSYIVAPLAPILEMKSRPDWIGAPIFTVAYTGLPTGDPIVDAAPALAIYPICTVAGDERCAAGATP